MQNGSTQAELAELRRLISLQQKKLEELETRLTLDKALTSAVPETGPNPQSLVNSSRRKWLKRGAAAILVGAGTATLGVTPKTTQASYIINPPGDNGLIGAILTPAGGGKVTGTLPLGSPSIGLLAHSDGNNLDLASSKDLPFNNSGVFGYAPQGYGVYGSGPYGVYGAATAASGNTGVGVYGISNQNLGVVGAGVTGVVGLGVTTGVTGEGNLGGLFTSAGNVKNSLPATTKVGLIANAGFNLDLQAFGANEAIGVYAIAGGQTFNAAGFFAGNVTVTGTLSKGGGSFKIDHPLDPTNKYLYHSFVESPEMLNLYNGSVVLDQQGEATVEFPAYFEALNKDFRYQLTSVGLSSPGLFIAEEIKDGKFRIGGGSAGQKVCWQVTGVRQDAWANANRVPIEEDKPADEKGYYLHPEAFGKSPLEGIGKVRPAAQAG